MVRRRELSFLVFSLWSFIKFDGTSPYDHPVKKTSALLRLPRAKTPTASSEKTPSSDRPIFTTNDKEWLNCLVSKQSRPQGPRYTCSAVFVFPFPRTRVTWILGTRLVSKLNDDRHNLTSNSLYSMFYGRHFLWFNQYNIRKRNCEN